MTEQQASAYREAEAALRARGNEYQIDPTLDRIAALVDLLGSPQNAYPVIHITGTNGKSSTARMIDTLLRERNLRVGVYTSPELESLRDRITIDGEAVSEARFVEMYEDIRPYVELIETQGGEALSFFEVMTAMAFAAFADTPVDVAVVEVGMGGGWDATNVADGVVSVVTPISLDHAAYLGDEIEMIAAEKAGIIKPGAVTVIAQQQVPAAEVLLRRAVEVGATVAREGLEFGVLNRDVAVGGQMVRLQGLRGVYDDVFLPLYGEYQAGNAATALAAVEAFASPAEGDDQLDPDLVRRGFSGAASPGRLEVVRRSPTVIVDAAHNPAGMAATVDAVRDSFAFSRLAGIVAVMADKDVVGLLETLEPLLTEVVVTRNSSSRSMPVDELADLAAGIFGEEHVHIASRMDDAIDMAIALAEETGEFQGAGVLVTGSVVTAADARMLLGGPEPPLPPTDSFD